MLGIVVFHDMVNFSIDVLRAPLLAFTLAMAMVATLMIILTRGRLGYKADRMAYAADASVVNV